MPTLKPSVQLYTVRDQVDADFPGTMKQLADIGYAGVELAGYGSCKTAEAARKACDDAGLAVSGAHVGLDRFETDLRAVLDEMATLGTKTVTMPWLPHDERNAAGFGRALDVLGRAAPAVAEAGLTLCYHNHAFEFDALPPAPGSAGPRTGMDVMFGDAVPTLKSELDVFWVKKGGHDPVAYIQKLGDRVALLHLKDMSAEGEKFAPIGTGTLDFPAIVAAGVEAGVEWGVVEQDQCYDTPPMDAVRTSFENLKKMGLVPA